MKIKEVKYGMQVLANIGNYENIRINIEMTAEVENEEEVAGVIEELKKRIRPQIMAEYKQIKAKSQAK
jgi:hypothetical protein